MTSANARIARSTFLAVLVAVVAACGPGASALLPSPATGEPGAPSGPPFDPGPAATIPAPTFPTVVLPPFGPASLPPVDLPPLTMPPVGVPLATFMPETFPLPDVPPPGAGRPPLRLRPMAVFDPAAGNVAAMTFLLPDTWQAEGSVTWMHQWARPAHLHTRVSDPATGITIEWLPLQDFLWLQAPAGLEPPIGSNYQGKAFVPPITDPVQFVQDFWMPGPLAHLQNATLVRVDSVPVVAEEMKRQYGGPAEAGSYRLRYEFQLDGQLWEEDVYLALLYSGSAEAVSWQVNFAYAVRAPQGVLDREQGIISTVIASRTTTPEWEATYRLVQQLFRQGIAQQMADTAEFGRQLAQYRAESQALQQQVVAERWASQDRIAELRRESLGGVQTYVNPFDQTFVQLPVSWQQYWVNAQGEYIVADTPNFDPNQFDNQGWQLLTPR